MARPLSAQRPSARSSIYSQDINEPTKTRRNQQRGPPKRSVSSLSATQLERKRANDREAQRLIRQRTKDRIDGLEKQIVELKSENERLNRCLRQRSIREMEILYKGNHYEADVTPCNVSKATNLSRGRQAPSPAEPSQSCLPTATSKRLTSMLMTTDVLKSAPEIPQRDYSPMQPESLPLNAVIRHSHASAATGMGIPAYYWPAHTTCSSTDESVDEVHTQYQRALPDPVYCLPSPYVLPPMTPTTLQCLLPNSQLHLLPGGR